MKTSVTIETVVIPADCSFQRCYCGQAEMGDSCTECGFTPVGEEITREIGTIWERVETRTGSATYSYSAGDDEQRLSRLHGALRRIVGYTVTTGWGHYGTSGKTGGLNNEGKYTTVRI